MEVTTMTLQERRQRMIEYLHLKVEEADWHGVADAAMDLREVEVEIAVAKREGQ
jgi:hypothetical protein